MSKETTSSGGIGFCGLLTLLLVAAKIFGKISISWFWVFSPLWIPLVALLLILFIVGLIALVAVTK